MKYLEHFLFNGKTRNNFFKKFAMKKKQKKMYKNE